MKEHRELQARELQVLCDPKELGFETTDQLEGLEGIIGQERAVRAITFGLGMRSFGYNIFVAGVPGTGKKTLVQSLVKEIARTQKIPDDLFFVHNFDNPDRPKVLQGPPGLATDFRRDMAGLVETLKEEVPKAFKSEDYETRKAQLVQEFQIGRAELIDEVQKIAKEHDLVLKASGPQIFTIPIRDGKELTPQQFAELGEAEQNSIQESQLRLSERIQDTYRRIRELQQRTQVRLKELERTVALISTGHYLDGLRNEYRKFPKILEYLRDVQKDIIDNITDFLGEEEGAEQPPNAPLAPPFYDGDPLKRYEVNVAVDNSRQEGAPVITETNPNFRNLIGFFEREAKLGTLYTDFTKIRPGSLILATGGYLILDMVDLLVLPMVWEALKRAMQDREVTIQDPSEVYGIPGTGGLRPEPVKVDTKVIILGNTELYNLFYSFDEDFQELFKVKADFDTVLKRTEDHIAQYSRFVKTQCEKEDLLHFDSEAVAALVEHSSRMVSDQRRLSLRFSEVADLIREASYWAAQRGERYVRSKDVTKAIEEDIFRSNLLEERLQEMIDENSILIKTSGQEVGQVNGLSVYKLGRYRFGKPTRLTAQVGIGNRGIVNIEREARLSGSIHDKGVFILGGYLHGKYGQQAPLSLNASICFEQSYSGVEGDSASSAELFAIISSLANIPLNQSVAVTGSVNQKGLIQPIGGVNEKIEGFFQTCKSSTLTGQQGVIIPHQNVANLMLRKEVIRAVADGLFHIYPIESVDEGLEVLTGLEAGVLQEDGRYPPGTVHFLVQKRLKEMAESARRLLKDTRDEGDKEGEAHE